jgi:hypothetical protein
MAFRTALTLPMSTSGASPALVASIERASVDTVTAMPADWVLLVAPVFASVLAVGPLLAAKDAALLLTATGLSEVWLIFMVFSKTTIYVAS